MNFHNTEVHGELHGKMNISGANENFDKERKNRVFRVPVCMMYNTHTYTKTDRLKYVEFAEKNSE